MPELFMSERAILERLSHDKPADILRDLVNEARVSDDLSVEVPVPLAIKLLERMGQPLSVPDDHD